MATVGILEAKRRLSELAERVARGEQVVITRRGVPVARVMPPDAPSTRHQARELAERIRKTPAGRALGIGFSVRDLIEEGRR